MRALSLVLVVAGCGGSPAVKPAVPTEPVTAAPTGPKRPPPPPTIEATCKRVASLIQEQCGAFGKTIHTTPAECREMFARAVEPKAEAVRERTARCVAEPADCAGVNACLGAMAEPDPEHLRTCEDAAGGGSVGVPAADYARRNGSSAAVYGDVTSTAKAPIERCGIADANAWLASLTCRDGSRVIHSHGEAETFRVGNIGANGRCGSIVDRYRVVCPEGATDIYIDAYVCPQ